MSAPTLTVRPHRNYGLFSDYYLDHTLPQRSDWRSLADDARPVMERVEDIFEAYKPSSNEAQTEQDLVRPVLKVLGHSFEMLSLRAPETSCMLCETPHLLHSKLPTA